MRIALACFVIVAVVVAIALMRLQDQPLSAPWIAKQAVNRVEALLGPGGTIGIAGSTVLWRGGTQFTVSLSDVNFSTSNRISGSSKALDVEISINPRAANLAKVDEIRVQGPEIVVPWPPPLPKPQSPWPVPVGPLDGANRILGAVMRDYGAQLIGNISIVDGTVRRLSTSDADPEPWLNDVVGLATITDSGDVLSVVVTGRSSRDRSFDAAFERVPSSAEDGGHTVSLSVKGFDFPFSRKAAEDPQGLVGWVPVDLSAFGDFTPDYRIRDVRFAADLGPGTVHLGSKDSVFLKSAEIELAWMPEENLFQFSTAHIEFGDSSLDLTGTLQPDSKDPMDPWRFVLGAKDAVINPSDVPGAPLVLEQVEAMGAFLPRERTIQVDRLSVLSPQAPIEGVGTFTFLDRGMLISGATNIGRMHANALKRLWPSFVVAGTRRWVLNNLIDGILDSARIDVSLGAEMTDGVPETTAGADEAVNLDFTFSGVTVKSFGEMSRVYRADGKAGMSGRRFVVDVDKASFLSPHGKEASASDGRFVIPDVFSPRREAQLSFNIEGSSEIVGAIADQKPVRALDRVGVAPDALSGQVNAKVDVVFPLTKKIAAADVQWTVDADFEKLSSATPISGRSIENADVNVVVDSKMVSMSGIATLDGVRANIQLTEPFGDPSMSLNGDLTLTLSEKERIDRGIDLGDVLKGPVAVGVGVLPDGNQQIAVDLTNAVVNIPVFGWTKAKGISGRANFLMRRQGKRLILDNFKMLASDAVIEGKIIINGNGRLETADLSRFTVRKGDVAKVNVKLVSKARYEIDFSADRFDGRGLIKTIKSQKASSYDSSFARDDFVVSANAKILVGFNGETMRNVVGKLALIKNKIESLNADAEIGKSGRTNAKGELVDTEASMTVTTSDSGSLLRFLNIYDGVEDGDGFLQYSTDANGQTAGHVTITDLTMRTSEEFSERLATTSQNLNLHEKNTALPSASRPASKTSFEKFRAAFVKTGTRLHVTEAFVRSPAIGGSFAGAIDLLSQSVALTGTMIPVYGLNNLFGQIPVLGTLMGAGRHGGLVGVTFRIDGPISDPKLLINPASALAPGIFRRIFEFR